MDTRNMNIGAAITLGLQLSNAVANILVKVKDAQDKGTTQIDLEFDQSLEELASVINEKESGEI